MPYRRLPKTDRSRLKALKTLLDNNNIYTVRERFIAWKDINDAKTAYDKLLTAVKQYDLDKKAQIRGHERIEQLQRNATLYMSHFIQVLKMGIERGEIRRSVLQLYSLPDESNGQINLQVIAQLLELGPKIIEGEKERIKKGGRPIYNPTIGMVSTHFDIFAEAYSRSRKLQQRTRDTEAKLKEMRPEIDALILKIWDQIETHFMGERVIDRVEECEKYGIKYYYRRKERREAESKNDN